MASRENLFFVLDVESVGLYGEAFAYGWVVVDDLGNKAGESVAIVHPEKVQGLEEDRKWVMENVFPAISEYLGKSGVEFDTVKEMRNCFWNDWILWKQKGAIAVSDCPYPVETSFFRRCVMDDPRQRQKDAPYPFLDVSTSLFIGGKDPLGAYERLADDVPKHSPLFDSRQSARLFTSQIVTMRKVMLGGSGWGNG